MSNIGRTRLVDGVLWRVIQGMPGEDQDCANCASKGSHHICENLQAGFDCGPGETWERVPTHVHAWVGWHLDRDGVPAPMICDHNPGQLSHTTRYRFEIPQDVLEHLAGTRECLMLNKFGKMHKDCREEA